MEAEENEKKKNQNKSYSNSFSNLKNKFQGDSVIPCTGCRMQPSTPRQKAEIQGRWDMTKSHYHGLTLWWLA